MIKSIIEEIYLDNQSISEKIKPSEEYKKVLDEAHKLYAKLKALLNDEQKELFESFTEAHIGVCAESEFTHFKEGLKFGLKLCIESLH